VHSREHGSSSGEEIQISSFYGAEKTPRLEVRLRRYKNLEWIARYANENIQKNSLSRKIACPIEYHVQPFDENEKLPPK